MTKKVCPLCEGPLVLFTSMNMKICGACKTEFDWNLSAGQKSITIEGLNGDVKMEEKLK